MTGRFTLSLALALAVVPSLAAQKRPAPNPIQREYQAVADRIIAAAIADSAAWNKLAELTDALRQPLSAGATRWSRRSTGSSPG